MEMEQRDIEYLLTAFLRAYKFYRQNTLPDKITFPMIKKFTDKESGVVIPIEFVEASEPAGTDAAVNTMAEQALTDMAEELPEVKEDLGDTNGPKRTSKHTRPDKSEPASRENEPKLDEDE